MDSNKTQNHIAELKSYMTSYQQLCDIPVKIWDGNAKEKFASETENIYGEYFPIINKQLDLYSTAIETYNKYCEAKSRYNEACSAYANATTEEEKSYAAAAMEQYAALMESLKEETNGYLNEICSMSINASDSDSSLSTGLEPKKVIDNIPEGLGDVFTYMGWQCITSKTSRQYQLMEAIGGVEDKFDAEGFGRINGRYVIACTQTYGEVGDYVDFVQKNGNVIKCIIGDIKSYKDPECTQWGHKYGQNIVEFVVDKDSWYTSGHPNPGTESCHPEWKDEIVKAINYGSYYDNPTFSG